MDVRVAGHQVDTGESLREHASRRMVEITEKYFARSVGANVTFEPGPNNNFTCNIIAPVTQGLVLKASYSAREAQMALMVPPIASRSSCGAIRIGSRSIRSTRRSPMSRTPATPSSRETNRAPTMSGRSQ